MHALTPAHTHTFLLANTVTLSVLHINTGNKNTQCETLRDAQKGGGGGGFNHRDLDSLIFSGGGLVEINLPAQQ